MVANSSTKDFRPISNNMTSSMRTHATPQQNGTAERKNRHILETSRALLLGAMVSSAIGGMLWLLPWETQVEESNWLMAPVSEHGTGNREVDLHEILPEIEHVELQNKEPGDEEAKNEEPKNAEYSQSPHFSVPEDFLRMSLSVEEALSDPEWA
ncbi:hypothetical protein CK203_034464 [Vitis vinifera]|uniref:Uncharacterized protein n=1 Tax=Vitis vinifera TaxID=29760 RepID=A0A438HZN9_VITVI|nr:hypothetical protein CK203_034464 [Vitis vinifera]